MAIWFEANLISSKEGREKASQRFNAVKEITIKTMFKGVRPQELEGKGETILAVPNRFVRLKAKTEWSISVEGRAPSFVDAIKLAKELRIPPDQLRLFEPHREWHHET